jgi:hypothetical protein
VDVILDAADLERLHPILAGDAAEVFPNTLFEVGVNPGMAVLGAKDDVVMQPVSRR